MVEMLSKLMPVRYTFEIPPTINKQFGIGRNISKETGERVVYLTKEAKIWRQSVHAVIKHWLPVSSYSVKIQIVLHMTESTFTKSDCDNYQKAILDALTGYWYLDDSQVVDLHTIKRRSESNYVEITGSLE